MGGVVAEMMERCPPTFGSSRRQPTIIVITNYEVYRTLTLTASAVFYNSIAWRTKDATPLTSLAADPLVESRDPWVTHQG